MRLVAIWIDNNFFKFPLGLTIMQACVKAQIDLPRFCYHERLSIAGSCRMCLVEVSNSKKLVVACAVPIVENLKIYTHSFRVKLARESVLEFLLANHPLDCPICDQGGECDLQDITMVYGNDRGRFYETSKRAVADKDLGPLIKTVMNRCIHCTRCIRFISELTVLPQLGTVGRGLNMEISTYIKGILTDELSGNIIDLCPVGALTSQPFAFTARTWELSSFEFVDVFDTFCTLLRVDVFSNKVMRILPRVSGLNEEWITNKARFAYDGFNSQRLHFPLVKILDLLNLYKFNKSNIFTKFVSISWNVALNIFLKSIVSSRIVNFFIGFFFDLESSFFLKQFYYFLGLDFLSYLNNNVDFKNHYLFTINLFDSFVRGFLLTIGLNIRLENPLLNLQLKNLVSSNKIKVYSLGSNYYNSYNINSIGVSFSSYLKMIEGKFILNQSLFESFDSFFILINQRLNFSNLFKFSFIFLSNFIKFSNIKILNNLFENDFISVLPRSIGFISTSEEGFSHLENINLSYNNNKSLNYYLGFDDFIENKQSGNEWSCYQGQHGGDFLSKINLVLPTLLFLEKNSQFLNFKGELQKTNLVLVGFNDLFDDVILFNSLITLFNEKFYYLNSFYNIIFFSLNLKVSNLNFSFKTKKNTVSFKTFKYLSYYFPYFTINNLNLSKFFVVVKNLFYNNLIVNYYKSDIITRSSKVMNLCSNDVLKTNFIFALN